VSPGQQPGDKEAIQYEIARASIPAAKPIPAWLIATPVTWIARLTASTPPTRAANKDQYGQNQVKRDRQGSRGPGAGL
jgi:hypothetical protein